jgi:dethiobiotin synthetase
MPHVAPRENLIVEGAGGVLVPINKKQKMIDLMSHLRLPVLLVARTALGTINHTLLSLVALRSERIEIRGVIMVGKENRDNRDAVEHYGDVQVVGLVPPLKRLSRASLQKVFAQRFDAQALRPAQPR